MLLCPVVPKVLYQGVFLRCYTKGIPHFLFKKHILLKDMTL